MAEKVKRKYRKMFTSEELKYAAQILNFFAPPPKCICESRDFKFGIKNCNILRAICLKCGKEYTFEPRSRRWLSIQVSAPLIDQKMELLLRE
jgi:hypothetical protein